MTKEQLWKIYAEKNPMFEGDKPIVMTPAGLKKLFDQTFEQGRKHGETVQSLKRPNDPLEAFNGIFNG